MKKRFTFPVLGLLLAMLTGCAMTAASDPRPIADDPVCLRNGDMACVRVRVDDRTPRAVYGGKTYYFCTDECRLSFEKNPTRYVPAAGDAGLGR
jgi:YHS domain-containing protein